MLNCMIDFTIEKVLKAVIEVTGCSYAQYFNDK